MVGANEYLSENVFQWLAHRHTQRLWERGERRDGVGNSRTEFQNHKDSERKRRVLETDGEDGQESD